MTYAYAYAPLTPEGRVMSEGEYLPAPTWRDALWAGAAQPWGSMIRRTSPDGRHQYHPVGMVRNGMTGVLF